MSESMTAAPRSVNAEANSQRRIKAFEEVMGWGLAKASAHLQLVWLTRGEWTRRAQVAINCRSSRVAATAETVVAGAKRERPEPPASSQPPPMPNASRNT